MKLRARSRDPGWAAALLLFLLGLRAARAVPEAGFSSGGEARERYEYYRNAQWGRGPQDDDGYWLQRYLLHLAYEDGQGLRLLAELGSSLENGRTGGPRATDEDRLDLHQAYLDIPASSDKSCTLRLGRQELSFGSSRLVSVRESPNVRLAFDGLRGTYVADGWRVDAFASRPVETNPDSFDDATDRDRALWGAYAVTDCPFLPGGKIDVYYLGLRRTLAVFDQGLAAEERHSFGARIWGRSAGWDYNWEFVGQFGRFGDGDIRAWTVATDTGFSPAGWPGKPRVGLRANVSSGDRDPGQSTLQTFNALFPRGAYFSEAALLGPANLIDLHPGFSVQPAATVTLSADWDWFWRESRGDGIYGTSVNLVRSGRGSAAREIGNQVTVSLAWQTAARWSVAAVYAHFFAGPFLRETGPAADVDYASTTVTFRF